LSLAILFHFLCAQHVSDINISIIRSFRLFCWMTTLVVLFLVRCVLEDSHRISNAHRTKNNTTNVVIQQNSRKLLMMDILMSETCWAHKKWNKITSDFKLVFYSSAVIMMHGPINIRFTKYCWAWILRLFHRTDVNQRKCIINFLVFQVCAAVTRLHSSRQFFKFGKAVFSNSYLFATFDLERSSSSSSQPSSELFISFIFHCMADGNSGLSDVSEHNEVETLFYAVAIWLRYAKVFRGFVVRCAAETWDVFF